MNTISDNAKAIFLEAVEKHSPGTWEAFLNQACGEDAKLRGHVEGLLQAHAEKDSLFDRVGETAELDRPSQQIGQQIGPYKLLQQIGEGGMGTVFMAKQTQPVTRRVALKIIKPGMDTKQVMARFEAERQALAMMDHPNIARVLDAGTTEQGRPYFVMELVKGVPITKYCDDHQLPTRDRLALFTDVCQAVQHAHHKGIIHRDLKPSNVLVAKFDDKPVVKVIDFGVAKATNQELTQQTMFTQFGQVIGTVEYMSPEQAQFNQLDIDTRSDIYSLGVLLYELLTGCPPLDRQRLRAAALDEVLRMIREEQPPKPSTRLSTLGRDAEQVSQKRGTDVSRLGRSVRGDVDWIVMKALDKDRGRRYETANGFASDVRRYLEGEPILARPPSTIYRLKKFAGRNKGLMASAASVLLAIGFAFAALSYSLNKQRKLTVEAVAARNEARNARDEAENARQDAETARYREERALETLRSQLIAWGFDHTLTSESESLGEIIRLADYAQLKKDWALTFEGARALHTGNNPLAREKLELAVKMDPDNIAAKSMLAISYFHDGYVSKWKQLMSTFDEWMPREEFVDIDRLFLEYARLYSDFDTAAVGLERLLNKHPDWHLARVLLAIAYAESAQDTGERPKLKRALDAIEVPLKLYPGNPFVLMVGQFVHEVALRLYEPPPESIREKASEIVSVLEQHKDYDAGILMVAGYYDLINDREKALAGWKELLDSRAFYQSRAMSEFYSEGKDDLDELILTLETEDPQAKIAQAYVLAQNPERHNEAQAILEEQLRLPDASRTVIRHHLLKLMLLLRMPDEAAQRCKEWTQDSSVDGKLWSEKLHQGIFQFVTDPNFDLNPEPEQIQEYFQVNYIKALLEYAKRNDAEALRLLEICNRSRGQSTEHHWARALANRWNPITDPVTSSSETP
ncbi:protein kinase [Stieleria sp. ICT_E10.1]|uniref:serine/threonine protein kinase n=1 Tax=Stieleria sedimenti TaxID=2976331 RepID=UPI0021806806|nr:serine/threonine-protein kinase [Stieleria sedimenti]MCS7471581.1 protein kinase [Stieleria sedimenti]